MWPWAMLSSNIFIIPSLLAVNNKSNPHRYPCMQTGTGLSPYFYIAAAGHFNTWLLFNYFELILPIVITPSFIIGFYTCAHTPLLYIVTNSCQFSSNNKTVAYWAIMFYLRIRDTRAFMSNPGDQHTILSLPTKNYFIWHIFTQIKLTTSSLYLLIFFEHFLFHVDFYWCSKIAMFTIWPVKSSKR